MSFPTKRVGDGKAARFAVPTYQINPETGEYVPGSGGAGALSVARLITPGTNVEAGQAVLISCTTAGVFTLELSSGNTVALNLVAGASFIDNLAVIDVALSGGAAGSVYVLDTP